MPAKLVTILLEQFPKAGPQLERRVESSGAEPHTFVSAKQPGNRRKLGNFIDEAFKVRQTLPNVISRRFSEYRRKDRVNIAAEQNLQPFTATRNWEGAISKAPITRDRTKEGLSIRPRNGSAEMSLSATPTE